LERERQLGVHHWDAATYGWTAHHHYVCGTTPLRFYGDFAEPSQMVDYRLYLPRLMADFEELGGVLRIGVVSPADVERLSEDHSLLVVATGRNGLSSLFPIQPHRSPYSSPQRRLIAGMFHGIADADPRGVNISVSPGHGELIAAPMFSRSGFVTAMLVEAVPGGDLGRIAAFPVQEDLGAFTRELRAVLGKHFPMTAERITDAFAITDSRDVLQGAVTPAVRADYVRLESETFAMSLGDAHVTIDPITGQGANVASYSSWVMGEAIASDLVYDERFCQRVAHRRAPVTLSISELTNLMLNPLPHVMRFSRAMAESKALCDAYGNLFNDPERQYDVLATPQRTEAFIAADGRVGAGR